MCVCPTDERRNLGESWRSFRLITGSVLLGCYSLPCPVSSLLCAGANDYLTSASAVLHSSSSSLIVSFSVDCWVSAPCFRRRQALSSLFSFRACAISIFFLSLKISTSPCAWRRDAHFSFTHGAMTFTSCSTPAITLCWCGQPPLPSGPRCCCRCVSVPYRKFTNHNSVLHPRQGLEARTFPSRSLRRDPPLVFPASTSQQQGIFQIATDLGGEPNMPLGFVLLPNRKPLFY